MTRGKRGALILAVVACPSTLLIGGCGETSRKGTTAAESASATKAQYVAESDAICTRLNKEANYKGEHIDELVKAFNESRTAQEVSETGIPGEVRSYASLWRSGMAQLQALHAPTEAAVTKLEVDRSNIATDLENLAGAASNADRAGIEAAENALRETTTAYRNLEQGYGFRECGAEH
jgi:hypothetical protein